MVTTVVRACFASLLLASSLAYADDDSRLPEDVPAALAVSADEKLTTVAYATGVQIYDCKASGASYAWTFRAPEATLYSEDGEEVGIHYVGPTWESNSGGTVVGAVIARVSSPDASAIPWLLLTAVSNDGGGPFKKVTSIQRLDTVGGKAPATGCDASAVGAEVEVPYAATYYFYKL